MCVAVLIATYLPPANGVGDTPPLPYYLYCLVGIAIMAVGVLYWAAWRILPGFFGYELVPRKERLEDGTTVTLVRPDLRGTIHLKLTDTFTCAVLAQKNRVGGYSMPVGLHVATMTTATISRRAVHVCNHVG